MKYNKIWFLVLAVLALTNQACEVEAEVFSEITPEEFFQNDAQVTSAASAAYTPLYGYWGTHELSDLATDIATVPIRSNNGWDDGGLWPRLIQHEFTPTEQVNEVWNTFSNGVSACNRLIEIFTETQGADATVVFELRSLRAFYFYGLLSRFQNIPLETRFSEADPAPAQVSPQEAFDFIEAELLASVEQLPDDKGSSYAKINKWVGYTILANLYVNAERITGVAHWTEAANAANEVINGGAYSLEPGYFANFKTVNAASNENIFVVPYERDLAPGFNVFFQGLHQSANGTLGTTQTPWGGFSIQEDFYNAYEEDDKRKRMFITGQQYTVAAGPGFSDDLGWFFANPQDEFRLNNCVEDWDNYAGEPALQAQIDSECNVIITPEYQLLGGRYLYKNGARYGKYQYGLGESGDISADLPIFRYALVLLIRAEALWQQDNGSPEALMLVNQVRDRAGVDPFTELTEDNLYFALKKELALENFGREITIRFGHWEDDWFLRDGNKEETKRFYPIPFQQLQSNASLSQNAGY